MKAIPHKRRLRQKTDYRKRLGLLKSGKTRLVVRRSLDNIGVQFISFATKGDNTKAACFSKELKKEGFDWKFGCGNVPAAYLTGFLAGVRAKKNNISEAVLDSGLQTSTKGSRIYAAVKGVIDAGVNVNVSQDVLPKDERISGKHINGDIEKNFAETKQKILKQAS